MAAEGDGVVWHRPQRLWPVPPPSTPIRLASPPQAPVDNGNGLLQVLLPMIGTLSVVAFAFVVKSRIYLIVSGFIVVAMVGGSLLTRVSQTRRSRRQRARERAAYRRHLEDVRHRAESAARVQRAGLNGLHPSVTELPDLVASGGACWERRPRDPDFATVRLGSGHVAAAAPVLMDVEDSPLATPDPVLADAAAAMVDEFRTLPRAPVTIPLAELGVVAIVGDRQRARDLAGAWLASLAALHAPGDLRMLGIVPADSEAGWEWAKWLPHLRDPLGGDGFGRASRTLVTDPRRFSENVEGLLGPRLEQAARAEESMSLTKTLAVEHAVVLVDGYTPNGPLGSIRSLDSMLREAVRLKTSVIVLVDSDVDVPSVCGARVDLMPDGSCTYRETSQGGRIDLGVTPEAVDREAAERVARFLAPLQLTGEDAHADLVDTLRLSDLLGLEHAGEHDPAAAWLRLSDLAAAVPDPPSVDPEGPDERPVRPSAESLLAAPIGVAADGETVILDLKESAAGGMGPHGILVGATGSGKSELLRTLTVSLAGSHDPELLSFVLVDFKGGAAFAGLEQLPHVAGVITNLAHDLALVDRVRAALTGELERRQEMLRDAGNFDSIRAYHAEAAAGADLPPLPYLVVIVDEFGELLAARPEFLDTFIAIGRLGRSLGVHLMLATQRLDEGRIRGLEPHLRYRACLRTFSAAESQTVLGSSAAFELPPLPGLGYLKVDSGMQRFKAALVSTAYRPPAEQTFRRAVAAELVRPFRLATPAQRQVDTADPRSGDVDSRRTDLSVLVDGMESPAGDRRAHQVWLPPLPATLTLGDLMAALPHPPRRLELPVGLLDLPERQSQQPMTLDLTGSGGNAVVVGAPRTGKSTVLSSLVVALASLHTTAEAQVYVMDLAGGALNPLSELPHVGAVVGRHEPDMIGRLLRELRALIEERAALARKHRASTLEQLRERVADSEGRHELPDTFLVIDGIGLLRANHPDFEQEVGEIAATGLQFGVHVVVAAGRWLDIRPALLDALGTRLELRLNDPIDSMAGKAKSTALPDLPGRGLTRGGVQFQAALPSLALSAALGSPDSELRRAAKLIIDQEGPGRAPRILPLPEKVAPRDIAALTSVSGGDVSEVGDDIGFLLGVQEFRTSPVRLDLLAPGSHLLVYGDGQSGRTTVLRRATETLLRAGPERVNVHIVDLARGLLELAERPGVEDYAFTTDQAAQLAVTLAKRLEERQPPSDLSFERLRAGDWWSGPQHVLVVDDYDLLLGPAGSPLTPLLDAIGQARDIGLHVLLARRASGSQRTAFEPFGQRLREVGATGLVMSGPTNEGPLVADVAAHPQPPGRGFLVRPRERTALVQCCVDDAADEDPSYPASAAAGLERTS
ncbi:MAG TPA: type VII secretion protein EccCa [Mycobacteriales bacterium]|nr:type VII secretion protein EccCa [Mycobacteriales bacterium]